MTDPFAGPAAVPSTRPSTESLRGRLVLISPKSQKTVADNFNPGQTKEQITADVSVVDGLGPVPLVKNRQPTGQFLDGPDFRAMWIDQTRIVDQLQEALKSGGMVLGRIDTMTPGTMAIKGNPWGLEDPTEEDKNIARAFLANRMVSGASAPAPIAPQGQAAYVATPSSVGAPMAAVAAATNPFAASAPAAQAPGVNPFAPEQ